MTLNCVPRLINTHQLEVVLELANSFSLRIFYPIELIRPDVYRDHNRSYRYDRMKQRVVVITVIEYKSVSQSVSDQRLILRISCQPTQKLADSDTTRTSNPDVLVDQYRTD